MKAHVYALDGTKKKEISLPEVFERTIREDLVWKAARIELSPQPYGIYKEAGRRHSASGIISHKRHDWKGQYGRGIARTPRKILWRRGTQFNWVGAEVSNTRGGRTVHGPKPDMGYLKMNKNEMKIALASAVAATAQEKFVKKHYASLNKVNFALPLVLDLDSKKISTKMIKGFASKILGSSVKIAEMHHDVRAGAGKLRGRRYKQSAGMLIVTGQGENIKTSSFDSVEFKDLKVSDLYPLGRLVAFSEKALEEAKKL